MRLISDRMIQFIYELYIKYSFHNNIDIYIKHYMTGVWLILVTKFTSCNTHIEKSQSMHGLTLFIKVNYYYSILKL